MSWIAVDIGILSLYVLAMQRQFAQRYQAYISLLSNLLLLVVALVGLYFIFNR